METKSKNVIELNGKRYDAITGAMLGEVTHVASVAKGNTAAGGHQAPIDGFFRSARRSTPVAAAAPAPVQKVAVMSDMLPTHAGALKPAGRPHQVAAHAKAHQPAAAKTLMRTAVKRPAPSLKQQTKVQGDLQHKVPSLIVTKQSAYSIDAQRLHRARTTERSPHIARHAAPASSLTVKLAPLAVRPGPAKPEPVVPSPQPTNKPVDIFEHAIANAGHFVDVQAHRRHFKRQTRRHIASLAAGTLALLVIAGFAAYQNTPGLQLKVASIQAGVSTTMPNFKAAGFAYNGVKAGNGKLTVGFRDQAGKYQLTQQTTNLSSQDMIQDIGATDASGTPDYTTVQAGGTTVYRFSNTNATWVANGKWYTVTGTGSLSDQQVTTLVQNI